MTTIIHRAIRTVILTLFLLPAAARADIIFVNNVTGDDQFNGLASEIRTQIDGPVATIGRAVKIATGTDSIVIANTGEPYVESVTLNRPDQAGSEAYPIIIEGNGATMRGAARLPDGVWRRVGEGTYRYQPFRKGHYQLVVNGKVAVEARADRSADAPPALQPLQWCAHRGFVYFRIEPFTGAPDEQFKYITDYEFEVPALEVGLGLHNARNVIVRNLNFEMFRLDGIAVTGNSRNVRLVNVRSTSNGRSGLSVAGASQVQVGNLDLAGNRVAERLVLMKGRIVDMLESQVPPKPAPAPMGYDAPSATLRSNVVSDSTYRVNKSASAASMSRN